ncbi:MAG TPA: DUF4279 domain-containing protein [Candidatus Melainabacteria bacterium]|nr:DUF4279 domain-containing protein [Candidatus Melainabacteria bacterium]HIN66132.1 DUF4279 domain-containing protein [Candidatus Obscuribacterales bacterium]
MAREGPYGFELEMYVFVDFSVVCSDLSIEEISETLELTPTEIVRKGDVLCEYKSKPFRSDTNLWRFSSEGKVRSNNLYNHTEWMVNQLFGKTPSFNRLKSKDAHLDLRLHIYSSEDTAFGFLTIETIKLLAQLDIEFSFDVSFVDFNHRIEDEEDDLVVSR